VVGEQEILGDFWSKAHIGCTYVERHEDTAPDGKSPDLAVLLRDAMSGRLNSPYTFADVCNISIDEASAIVVCRALSVRVRLPANCPISPLLPTATKWLSSTANASAFGKRESTV
jgi:hypothetical protein